MKPARQLFFLMLVFSTEFCLAQDFDQKLDSYFHRVSEGRRSADEQNEIRVYLRGIPIQAILAYAESPSSSVRSEVATLLQSYELAESESPLLMLVSDKNADVKVAALKSLTDLDSEFSNQICFRFLWSDKEQLNVAGASNLKSSSEILDMDFERMIQLHRESKEDHRLAFLSSLSKCRQFATTLYTARLWREAMLSTSRDPEGELIVIINALADSSYGDALTLLLLFEKRAASEAVRQLATIKIENWKKKFSTDPPG